MPLGADPEIVHLQQQVIDALCTGQDASSLLEDKHWPGGYRPFAYMGHIPDVVENEWATVQTTQLALNKGAVKGTWASSLLARSVKYAKKKAAHGLDLSQVHAKFGTKLLFRGIAQYGPLPRMLRRGFYQLSSPENEFGDGLYASPDIDYALQYVLGAGTLLIFDWSDNARDVTTKQLDGDLWATTVKANVCQDLAIGPDLPDHDDCDILMGPVSANHTGVFRCNWPVASNDTQYMANSPNGFAAFERRLVGVVYYFR